MRVPCGRFANPRMLPAAVALLLAVAAAPAVAAKDFLDTLAETRSLSTLLAAIKAAGLEDSLRGPGPYTLFAPTDEAFAALPPGLLDALMKSENRPQLAVMISHHLLPRRLSARDQAGRRGLVVTVAGNWLAIDGTGGGLMIDDGVEVLSADITTDNGVIHIIDSVLLQDGASGALGGGAF